MADSNEVGALQASFRGAAGTADALAALAARVEGLAPGDELDPALLDELRRVSTAHAIASAALRGLIETLVRRREAAG